MTITQFVLYLLYGFSMIIMGIFALMQRDARIMNVSLIKSLKYLGLFGIAHGVSEWVTMIIKLELCHPNLHTEVYYANLILKALSFAFLMHFGLELWPVREKYKNVILRVPLLGFLLYLLFFDMFITAYGAQYHMTHKLYNTVAIRYLLAIPACVIAAAALYCNAGLIKAKSVEISRRYQNLALILLAYGLVEGLLTMKTAVFPEYFSHMTLAFKAIVGFIIVFLLIKVIDTFSWEQKERLYQLEKLRIVAEERSKLGLEIHDSIIQELYAVGLKLEFVSKNLDQDRGRNILEEMKSNLTTAIKKTREFISVNALDEIELDKLKDSLEKLVGKYNNSQGIKIVLNWKISPYLSGIIGPEKTTQIYYIIQEAVTNIIKHSKADFAEILLEGSPDFIYVTIIDNGKGISHQDLNLKQQFGIHSMKERAQRANGFLQIESLPKGTRIELRIPWEEIVS